MTLEPLKTMNLLHLILNTDPVQLLVGAAFVGCMFVRSSDSDVAARNQEEEEEYINSEWNPGGVNYRG